jgi:3-hydroxy acid dehydrogenase / malonic semialdehyde reductase
MLRDKTVFITGAGSGIGKATAKKLWELGAKVFSLEASASNIAAACDELGDERLRFFEGDVRDPVQVRAAFEACDQAFGPVDVLINNAGSASRRPIWPRRTWPPSSGSSTSTPRESSCACRRR